MKLLDLFHHPEPRDQKVSQAVSDSRRQVAESAELVTEFRRLEQVLNARRKSRIIRRDV